MVNTSKHKDRQRICPFKNEELSKVDQNEDDVLPTLKLSYPLLPAHLKQCFAYCRLFPKDQFFEVEKITDLWRAQRYIVNPSNSDLSVLEIGDAYYKDLLWRSFLELGWRDELGDITHLKMHDLMHDLATLVAGPTSTILSMSNSIDIDEETRHVSFYFENYSASCWEAPSSLFKASKLRTILFLSGVQRLKITEEQCHVIFSKCRLLRVLDLHDVGIKIVPRSIAKLRHLRYLDLSDNQYLEMLPDSISRLQNLEVLNLNWCFNLYRLPRDIKKLVNLRRLYLLGCGSLTHMPPGIGQLTGLEELSKFVVGREKGGGGLGELSGLNCLRGTLEITNLPYVKRDASEFREANLKMKQHIKELGLSWENEGADSDDEALEELHPHQNLKKLNINYYNGLRFPRWISSLTNLKSIKIFSCQGFTHLTQLHDLPCLIELQIDGSTNLEYIESNGFNGNSGSGFLQSLKTLSLSNCPNLKGWWPPSSTADVSLQQFHCLSSLDVHNCLHLTSIPLFPPLQTMKLRNASRDLLLHIFKIQTQTISSFPYQEAKSVLRVPEESLQNLSSLEEFVIFDNLGVEILMQASHGQHLTSLEALSIRDCEELNLCGADQGQDDGIFWDGLRCLNYLSIQNVSKLSSLPDGISRLPNLRSLNIYKCPNLKSLPEWMANTSLQSLAIRECDQLSERCRDEDRHLIAHIPSFYIR